MDLREVPSGRFLRHPWELARAEFMLRLLQRAGVGVGQPKVLDVGSGDAWFVRQLLACSNAQATCWDVGYAHDVPEPQPRVTYCANKPEGTYDWILLLDVAEHVPDDRAFVQDVLSLASPGAKVLLSVPAWPQLYTDHDEGLRHYRRYTPRSAKRLLTDSGLRVIKSGGVFHSLLIPRTFARLAERRQPGETLTGRSLPGPNLSWRYGVATQRVVLKVLRLEGLVSDAAASLGLELPGLSYFALCQQE